MNSTYLLTALGAAGSLSVGVYLTRDHWMPQHEQKVKSIEEALKGRRLISSLPENSLTKQWEAEFESASNEIKNLLGNNSLNAQTGGVELSKWCSSKMSLNVDENMDVFKNVEKYCLIRSISSQLARKQKTLLKEEQADEWKSTYKKRQDTTSKRADVGLSGDNWTENDDLSKVKAWCTSNSEQEFLASQEGTDSMYSKVLKWCTKEGANES
ncbi:hypothetical protein MHC_04610 [Mycoplasma haemocanis str. Illinois]|uniref:Uncharacterized protein n=1 Tax=Mycoplasma haemocanis (strain Illinois) TaxID=1111676 RepID=H6N806_MYCHN|nr:hypothetical protein [Mycoplasma haemocanis]AEW45778.2 hypothetical protein MHC_04610 [Mycoplasma haemocanis str. Illinois]